MISDLSPAAAASHSFAVPPQAASAYTRLVSSEAMEECQRLLRVLGEIRASGKVLPACKRLAAGLNGKWGAARLRAKYYEFLRGNDTYPAGDWRICLNHAKAPIHRADITSVTRRAAFIEYWRKLGENHHQDWAAAHDELLKIWRTGFDHLNRKVTAIPGYDQWPQTDEYLGYPDGWSYANLMRFQSDPYDQAAARVGHAFASQHRLPVLTTRVGLQFGQYFEFDDHEFNQRVLFQRKPMRPLGFGAIELLSGDICHLGMKPTLWDYEDEVKRKLTEKEFMWFVISLLTTVGYRADIGTRFIVERGTAAIRAPLEAALARVSNDKILIERGGRFGQPAHAGQWSGRAKGNFRTKALIEGAWGIVDNQMDSLPAQTGRGRGDAPEGFSPQAGAEKYTAAIFRTVDALEKAGRPVSPDQIAQLKFAYPMYHDWRLWALDAIDRINRDPDHSLEGWEKLGFVQPVWRLPSQSAWLPWQAYTALPSAEQAVVKAMLDADRSLVKSRRLSRHEVFSAGLPQLTRLPWELLPSLVGPEHALNAGQEPLEVKAGLIRFECAEMDPDPIEFYARDYRAASNAFLPNGAKYICYVNPYAPTRLVATDAAGKVVAICPRYARAVRHDEHAIRQLKGDQQAFEAAARARLNLRHADDAAAKQAMLAGNQRLLAPRAPSPDPARSRALRKFQGDLADLVEPAAPNSPADDADPAADLADFAAPQPAANAEPSRDDFSAEGLL